MYHKGNRESINCMDDIVLIQANSVENYADIQDLKVNHFIRNIYDFPLVSIIDNL